MKYIPLTDEIYTYSTAHRTHDSLDGVLDALRGETEALGEISVMAAVGAHNAIEIGTFTGYSAMCIAAGLPADGKLLCLDQSDEWTRVGRKYWAQSGLNSKIELRLGDAKSTLAATPESEQFDFAFVDAEKTGYDAYYELLLPRLKPNALIVFDNMLSGGRLASGVLESDNEKALDTLNKKLAKDERVESVLLALADGLNVCRKK